VFFAERVINAWNSLPSDTVDFSTLKSFKRSIQTMDLSPVTASALPSVVLVLDVDCVYFLVMMFVCFYSRPIL